MIRVPRMILFSTTFVLILMAFASGIFSYMLMLNTSPFAKTEVFPAALLTDVAILCPILLIAGLAGCCGLYRLSPTFLKMFIICLFALCGLTAFFAQHADQKASASIAAQEAQNVWDAASNATRQAIMQDFACFGWMNTTAPHQQHVDSVVHARRQQSDDTKDSVQVISPCAAGFGSSCTILVIAYRTSIASSFSILFYNVMGFTVVTLLAALVMLLVLHLQKPAEELNQRCGGAYRYEEEMNPRGSYLGSGSLTSTSTKKPHGNLYRRPSDVKTDYEAYKGSEPYSFSRSKTKRSLFHSPSTSSRASRLAPIAEAD
ncbi:hypothetical protein DFS34DRAFT_644463 [Phlyctochytrium arcticum]|nr:hypothetical protein DFS34DRAFT_644463 [Phlyctochytrium arcticum]